MERNMELDNEKIIDNDLEKLLAILYSIPEEKIPDRFERRLSETLKEEGKRIRQEKLLITARKRRNRYLKASAVIAACFVVVFASLSVYNDDIGLFSGNNASEEAPVGDIMLAAEDSDSTAEVLKRIIEDGKGIEINTSSFRYDMGDHTVPSQGILQLYHELGGEIVTVGSDAHAVRDVGFGIQWAYDKLRSVGFRYLTTFCQRKPSFVKL